jgi:hypothetical protein
MRWIRAASTGMWKRDTHFFAPINFHYNGKAPSPKQEVKLTNFLLFFVSTPLPSFLVSVSIIHLKHKHRSSNLPFNSLSFTHQIATPYTIHRFTVCPQHFANNSHGELDKSNQPPHKLKIRVILNFHLCLAFPSIPLHFWFFLLKCCPTHIISFTAYATTSQCLCTNV